MLPPSAMMQAMQTWCWDGSPARLIGDTWMAVLRDMSAARLQREEEEEALQGWLKAVLEAVQESS